MQVFQQFRRLIIAFCLGVVLLTTSACAGATQASTPTIEQPRLGGTPSGIERGTTPAGQAYGDWLVQSSKDVVTDAYVRDGNQVGVVIDPKVKPNQVRSLARSVAQSFRQNFPDRDLTVRMYAPDKTLILTARYSNATQQIEYEAPKS